MKYIPYLSLKHIKRFFGNIFSFNSFKVFLVLITIGAWFYWFQYRPTQIRKDCWQKVVQEVSGKGEVNRESMNNYFSVCLVGKGLKSESLF